ncbi:MAG: hypothetical protein EPN97_18395 [Alphaproteobacteria bacterium]|nr:MAG: hypothetical protein EPN97_18395 [Alphaproteobacteria bacterium]
MKKEFNRHGRRLTDAEYEKKIVALYTGASPIPGKAEEIRLRKAELNLQIDHKLGVDFPAARREEMWKTAEAVEKGRLTTAFKIVMLYVFKGKADEKHMDGSPADADHLTRYLVKKYSAVLDDEELTQFLGPKEDRVLPPNRWRL